MSRNDLHEVELQIEDARKMVKRGEALDRLFYNKDFQEVILEQYFREEPIRLVHLKSDPEMGREDRQAYVLGAIDAIGHFRTFLDRLGQEGDRAKTALAEAEETRDEIMAEDDE